MPAIDAMEAGQQLLVLDLRDRAAVGRHLPTCPPTAPTSRASCCSLARLRFVWPQRRARLVLVCLSRLLRRNEFREDTLGSIRLLVVNDWTGGRSTEGRKGLEYLLLCRLSRRHNGASPDPPDS